MNTIESINNNSNLSSSGDDKESPNIRKKKICRPFKISYYTDLRKQFVGELSSMLNINDDNNIVYMEQINDDKIQSFVLSNEDKIKLYFKYVNWSYYKRGREETRQFYALIKNIYKHEGYTIYCKKATLRDKQNNTYSTSKFIFYRPNSIIK